MKLLCLHGVGGNAQMFEAQTNQITSVLKSYGHEFDFYDGVIDCEPPDDRIKQIYPPPYLAFYKSPIPEDVADAVDLIESIIEDEGPFDGILGFSQGCCVATSLMFERQKANTKPPFRFGVFIGASLPFNADDLSGKEVWEDIAASGKDPRSEFAGELELLQSGKEFILNNPDTVSEPVWLRRYHSLTTPAVKLQIPVLHVMGSADPYVRQARTLASMHENAYDRLVIEHAGAHEVPRDATTNNKIAKHMLVMMGML
ncbi:ef-hand calcium-binding domain protein [Zymoseptoria brevis]|uniref:Ef-hand calcium-binding domain protein n=1 Tax=Zymoseptoria brevis TaxID=1047168 RepID=A0A0F4GPK7_9PEZI|nr:ef-hand calcium-binding domain protein [Zymoseptoria brevis]